MGDVVPFVIAAAISLVLTPAAIALGVRLGLIDRPGELKIHERPVPVTGGAAVAVAASVALAVSGALDPWLLVALAIALVLGSVDDLRSISPALRLAGQSAVGMALVLAGFRFGPLGFLAAPALVLVVVATCNAVNVVDGQDGLAGGVAVLSALGLAAVLAREELSVTVPIVCAGAVAGFLVWNRPPARVFLGDGGAYVIAVLLSAGVGQASTVGWHGVLAAGACLGVFAYELLSSMARRLASRGPAMLGDRDHSYDRLARVLGSRAISTGVMLAVAGVAAAIGWAIAGLTAAPGFLLVLAVTAVAVTVDVTVLANHGVRRRA